MKKVALMLADGFEEIEALTVVDVLRRAQISCEMVGFSATVTGSHGITVTADRVFEGSLKDYDAVVLPGGMPGARHLRDKDSLLSELRQFQLENKWIAAICAAPIALAKAGVLKDKHYTCYDGVQAEITDGSYQKETVVVDGHLITSRGPATALAFSYALVEHLGKDAKSLKKAMLYADVFGE